MLDGMINMAAEQPKYVTGKQSEDFYWGWQPICCSKYAGKEKYDPYLHIKKPFKITLKL